MRCTIYAVTAKFCWGPVSRKVSSFRGAAWSERLLESGVTMKRIGDSDRSIPAQKGQNYLHRCCYGKVLRDKVEGHWSTLRSNHGRQSRRTGSSSLLGSSIRLQKAPWWQPSIVLIAWRGVACVEACVRLCLNCGVCVWCSLFLSPNTIFANLPNRLRSLSVRTLSNAAAGDMRVVERDYLPKYVNVLLRPERSTEIL